MHDVYVKHMFIANKHIFLRQFFFKTMISKILIQKTDLNTVKDKGKIKKKVNAMLMMA